MLITPSFKKSLIVEQFQRNYPKCIVYLLKEEMPFLCPCLYFTPKVDLIWKRAIRPVIAQSVQFRNIANKIIRKNIDFPETSPGGNGRYL